MTDHAQDFTRDDGEGICTLCGADASIVNGVAMHFDGWRDDACDPRPVDVRLNRDGDVR